MSEKEKFYKCPICGVRDRESNLTLCEELYKVRRVHPECANEKLKVIREDRQEQAEKDSMYEKWAEVYSIDNYEDMNQRTFQMFANLRAGNPVFKGKSFDKRYRAGFSYPVIERTIIDCEDRIKYANGSKDFDSIGSAMYYGIKIIVDRIPSVSRIYEREMRAKAVNEERRKETQVNMGELESFSEDSMDIFKRKQKERKNERDISAFISEEE